LSKVSIMRSNWYRGIVVGVDGSAESMAAVDWAALAADRHGARLTVLGAYVTPPGNLVSTVDIADLRSDARYAVERSVARLNGALPGGRMVEERIVLGSPAYMLAQRSRSCDLVVVGRRGLGTWDRAVLGSVSGALAASAPGPVAVVPAGAGTGDPSRVVAGVSGDDAGPQLDMAFAEAQQRSCPLEVVHAFEPDPLSELGGPSAWRNDVVREDVADQVARWSDKYPTVSHTVAFRSGNAVDAILQQLGPDDLVVVGGRQHSPAVGHIRHSVPDAVLRQAPCPVIVVHEQRR
jgi:nucleotide-binding universal stress UspA family protein